MNQQVPAERANKGLHDAAFSWMASLLPEPPASILDLGAGSGAWLSRWQQAGVPKLMGLDLDSQQFLPNQIPVHACNLDDWSGKIYGQFACITALEIMEHLANPGNLMRLAAAHLEPGGHLLITTPNIHGLPGRLRYLLTGHLPHFDTKSDPTHIYPVYAANLEKLAARYGFSIAAQGAFPEKNYQNHRGITRIASAILGTMLPDALPGDNRMWWLRYQG